MLSFVMSEYYEANNRNAQACSFAGNGTVNPLAPTSVSAANAAATSCLASASAVFTPTAPAGAGGGGSASSSAAGHHSGAAALFEDARALVGLAAMAAVGLASAAWTLV